MELFVEATRKLFVGDPSQEATQIGPLVSAGQRQAVEEYITEARSAGRKIATGGERPPDKGYYLQPTVVLGCETSDRVWREEVFGPVV